MPRKVFVKEGNFSLGESVEVVFEKKVTPFGNSGKVDVPLRYVGKRAYVIVVKD
jgi:putative transposon-encoded protein